MSHEKKPTDIDYSLLLDSLSPDYKQKTEPHGGILNEDIFRLIRQEVCLRGSLEFERPELIMRNYESSPQLVPIDLGITLEREETSFEKKSTKPIPIVVVREASLKQSEIRQLVLEFYSKEDFPDIHRVVERGALMMRIISSDRVERAILSGTDRDASSQFWQDNEAVEKIFRSSPTLSRSGFTYASMMRLSNKDADGGEQRYGGSMFGNVLLVYDPRHMRYMTDSSLVYFDARPLQSLLAVIEFVI